MLLNEGVGKGASLIAQVFLGYLLTKEDFGVFALATSVSLVAAGFGNGGIHPILIQRGAEFEDIGTAAFRFALVFNLLACGLLAIAGPIAAQVYGKPELEWLLICIGVSLPLVTPSMLFRSKLSIDHRFRNIANIGILSNWVRQGSTVLMAFLGFGALSFGIPPILESVVGSLAGWRAVKRWPPRRRLTRQRFAELFAQARWVIPGSFAAQLTQRGDYFVIGLFVDAATLGIYFFGLQLVSSVSVMFVSSIEAVMLPALAKQTGDAEVQGRLFLRTLSALCFLSMPIAFAIGVFSEPAVEMVWQGRWNDAIPVTQWLAASLPATLIVSISRSLMEARARWQLRFWLLALYGGLGIAVAGAVAYRGGIVEVAAAITVYRALFAIVQMLAAASGLRVGFWTPLKHVLRPAIFIGLAAGLAIAARRYWLEDLHAAYSAGATYGVFLASLVLLGTTLFRRPAGAMVGELAAYLPARFRPAARRAAHS
jgi:O-antigen/teichoic acid export membrane protein